MSCILFYFILLKSMRVCARACVRNCVLACLHGLRLSHSLFISFSLRGSLCMCVWGGGAALFACKYTIHVCVSSTYQSKFFAVIKTFAKAFETFTVSETRITLSGEITTFKMSKAHLFTKPVIICSVV